MKTISILFLIIFAVNSVSLFASKVMFVTKVPVNSIVISNEWHLLSAIDEIELNKMTQRSKSGLFTAKIVALQSMYRKYTLSSDRLNSTDASSVGVIRKPIIYAAIKNIEKHYYKLAKQKKMDDKDLTNFEHILRVAIATLDVADFGDFEVSIATDRECPECQIDKFMQVRLQNIY